ncbi:hypothetical protein [Edwardsiella piscicida]|uniref:hypothetical protein n=1 Tax=Edwardsiella piscicida TaxID=1263550 RepID=UPI00370D0B27
MLSKTGFTHSDLLRWQIDYAGCSLNVNGTIMRGTYNSIKKVGEENIEKSSHMLEILSGIEGNGISTGNKLERCIERLSEFNVQMNVQRVMFKEHFENVCDSGISNAKSINEMLAAQATQTNLFKEHFEFVQKMSHANHEQLKNIIDSQANYINEQGRFKNKLKDVLKVIANEN